MISNIGIGSASIAIEELIEFGVERIIRVGTCGRRLNEIRAGDIIVPTASLIDGPIYATYIQTIYMKNSYASSPNWIFIKDNLIFVKGFEEIYNVLIECLKNKLASQNKHKFFVGPIHDKDILYAWRPEYNYNHLKIKLDN